MTDINVTASYKIIQRVSALWFIILLGLMYHIILHLAPIFYGVDIVKEGADGNTTLSMVLVYGFSFFIPVLAVVNAQYTRRKVGKIINAVLSSLALLVNTAHLSEIFITGAKHSEHLFVLIPLFAVSVLLIIDAIKWFKYD